MLEVQEGTERERGERAAEAAHTIFIWHGDFGPAKWALSAPSLLPNHKTGFPNLGIRLGLHHPQ